MDKNPHITAGAWIAGAATWLGAALVGAGAEDGSDRFYTAEGIWVVAQLLLLAGLLGLIRTPSRPAGGRRLGAVGLALAVAGRIVFLVAEAASIASGEPAEAILPIGAMLTAVGMTLFGIAVARAHRWEGWLRLSPLAMGVYPFLFMFPLVAVGMAPDASIAIWALPTAGVGAAIARSHSARFVELPSPA
jgi:hypothetical protein